MARTIFDCCGCLYDEVDRLGLLDDARRRSLVSWPELWETLVLHAVRGRPGVRAYRALLVRRWGARGPDTRFARLVSRLLEDAGLPEPVAEHEVRVGPHTYRIDLAFPDRLLAVECIGREGHLNERSFESDPVRRNRLELAGWLVLEFTWERFVHEPSGLVAETRAAFVARSPSSLQPACVEAAQQP